MGRHMAILGIWWAILTAAGEFVVHTFEFNPARYAVEARIVDEAFDFLMVLSVPIFALIIAVLTYGVLAFRAKGDPPEDGPAMFGHLPLTAGWLAVSAVLSVFVIINPGVLGMLEFRQDQEPDVTVQAQGMRWVWRITYPQYEITTTEMVLPVGKRIKFDISATDVIHSFWIPAFRIKIDAVPGLATTIHATPTRVGSFEEDESLRLQCTELCGLAHYLMSTPVRVVEPSEFDAWVAEKQSAK